MLGREDRLGQRRPRRVSPVDNARLDADVGPIDLGGVGQNPGSIQLKSGLFYQLLTCSVQLAGMEWVTAARKAQRRRAHALVRRS